MVCSSCPIEGHSVRHAPPGAVSKTSLAAHSDCLKEGVRRGPVPAGYEPAAAAQSPSCGAGRKWRILSRGRLSSNGHRQRRLDWPRQVRTCEGVWVFTPPAHSCPTRSE